MTKMKRIKSGRFTQIANTIFEDARLLYKEIGLYCNMMKFPDDWEFSIRYLADLHQDKKAAVTTGLEKLIELGYIAKVGSQQRNKQGTFSTYDYVIFEDPTDNPKFIPYRHGKAETTVSDFQTTESRIGEISYQERSSHMKTFTEKLREDYTLTEFEQMKVQYAELPEILEAVPASVLNYKMNVDNLTSMYAYREEDKDRLNRCLKMIKTNVASIEFTDLPFREKRVFLQKHVDSIIFDSKSDNLEIRYLPI